MAGAGRFLVASRSFRKIRTGGTTFFFMSTFTATMALAWVPATRQAGQRSWPILYSVAVGVRSDSSPVSHIRTAKLYTYDEIEGHRRAATLVGEG